MEAHDIVKALIQTHGLTQGEIAARTGIPQPTVSKIFRGVGSDVLSRSYRKLQALHESLVAAQPAKV